VKGDRYEGQWMNNKRHGRGILFYADGKKFVGEWENGLIIFGTLYSADGSVSHNKIGYDKQEPQKPNPIGPGYSHRRKVM